MALIKCNECGKEISDKADVCINCGCPMKRETSTYNSQPYQQPITINNTPVNQTHVKIRGARRHGCLFDMIMIFLTAGLWIIWMIIRPKYY